MWRDLHQPNCAPTPALMHTGRQGNHVKCQHSEERTDRVKDGKPLAALNQPSGPERCITCTIHLSHERCYLNT